MNNSEKQDVDRNRRNFSRVPAWNTIFNKDQVNYMFETFGTDIFCNGHLRTIKADALTDTNFKVYTIPF